MNKQSRLVWLLLVIGIVLAFGQWQTASAATITVNNLGDGTASALRCPSTSSCRLRDAIAKAVAGDTITFSVTGTITLTNGQLNLTRNVIINGPGATLLTISGNNVSRVFNINSGITVTLSSLRIANGNSGTGNGGGILNAGILTLTNSTINANAGSTGSGIYNSGSLTVTGSTISSNTATSNGGGIYNASTLNLTNSTFTGNSAPNGSAIYNTSNLTMTSGTLSNNANSAILNSATGTATLTGSTVSGSTSAGINNSGVLFLTNSTLSGNSGSGMFNSGTVTIAGSTFSGNSSSQGGGGVNNSSGTATITNSTISGNSSGFGAGISNNATLNLTNCTITKNVVTDTSVYGQGGGIYTQFGTVNIRNTILAGNIVPSGAGVDASGTLNSQGYNLIGTNATIVGVATGNILNRNALLSPLGNYGGPTQTHALLPGSPALNAGDNCVTVSGGCLAQPLATDQRGAGFLRTVNTTVDMGAFESRGFTMAIAGGNNQTALPYQNFPYPLSVTVTAVAAGEPVAGGQVTFTPPTTGASATIAGNPATIVGITATTGTVTANNNRGVYNLLVQAGGPGLPTVTFTLSNICSATNLVVTNNNSDGAGSLRAAIAGACPGSTITFTSSAFSIATGGSPIVINQDVVIQGPGTGLLGISGSGNSPVFKINSGVTASISGMGIYNGFASSTYRGGGGIFNQGNLTISNVVLSDSAAALGGGIYNQGTLTVNNSTVARNRAGAGGGIYNDAGSVTITGSTFTANSSTGSGGGGIYASGGTVSLASSAIYNNSSVNLGGGVSLYQATAAFTNSTLSGNSAKSRGGGIAQSGGTVTLTNSTLSSNSVDSTGTSFSPNGGGISNYGGILNARNTLIALNILSNNLTSQDVAGALTSQGYNLIGDDRDATISGITTGNILNQNPLLAPLGNYGGPTPTHALLPGSPAINAGTTTSAPATDQRGIARVGNVDIGAFESRGFRLAIASGNNQIAWAESAFPNPLSVTVTANGAGEPVSGGQVTFTPPVSGASCTVAGSPATISGSTATTGIVTANAIAEGPYSVVVNMRGATNITPLSFSLTNACVTLHIISQPQSQAVCVGSPATFEVAAGGTSLTYQWRKNGLNIAGATSRSYTTPITTFADNGALYSVVVSGVCGSSVVSTVVSDNATLMINSPSTVVTSNADSGPGSLRAAIDGTCNGGTITFVSGISLITLTSGELSIGKNLTIQGPGAAQLTISGNNASRVFRIAGTRVSLRGLTIANGNSGSGGGIFSSGSLSLNESAISGNSSRTGGGLYITGSLDLINSTISGNIASSTVGTVTDGLGGGIYSASGSVVNLIGGTISANTASQSGGGILSVGNLSLVNSTIYGNRGSNSGGGISIYGGTANARNTIIAGNTTTGPIGYVNLYGQFSWVENSLFGGDPLLAPLGNYGGPTQTHALLPGSPAINAGNNCVLTNSCSIGNIGFNLNTDQRSAGFNRQVGSAVDIGAFESRGFTLSVASGNNQSTAINTAFASPLAVMVAAVGAGEPTSGGRVTFTPPLTGASATIAGSPATITGNTAATGIVTANATAGGPYSVAASAAGGTTAVNFSLTNTASLMATTTTPPLATASAQAGMPGQGRKAAVIGDYDGDGKSDLAVWRSELSQWQILYSSTGEVQIKQLGSSSSSNDDVSVIGDFDGDGKADLAIFRRGGEEAGHWFILRSSDGVVTDVLFGSGGDVPVAADYDGDGKTDLAVWRGAEATWRILRSSDNQEQTVSWGTSRAPFHDVPVPADYDGDGKVDIAVFRRANGHWYIRLSSDGSVMDRTWGSGKDVPVASDYDGDGKADIAVWRGAEGAWYVLRSSDGMTAAVAWGASNLGDVPVPGDYDGDGRTDIAVWRASEGAWYVRSSADASTILKAHGQSGDLPTNARKQ